MISPYSVLGLSEGASSDEVKSAYRKLVKECHPDRNQDDPDAVKRFHEVQQAYEEINNPKPQTPPHNPFAGGGFHFRSVIQMVAEIPLEVGFTGGKVNIALNSPNGATTDVELDIRPMTNPGSAVRVSGLPPEMGPIDLIVIITYQPHGNMSVRGDKLVAEHQIDFVTAILGGEVKIETMDGPRYFNVPSGSKHGSMVRLPGLGFRNPHANDGSRDDLIVILNVDMPSELSEEQRNILLDFRKTLTK